MRRTDQSERLVDGTIVPELTALQARKTSEWHHKAFEPSASGLLGVVEEEHRCNFELWHEEDRARRDDQGYEFVYRAKRSIDEWNQRRNDNIERIDKWLVDRIPPLPEGAPMHSETPAMIIDRLSILALKEYHMAEEAHREDASAEQRAKCQSRLAVIQRQRSDLAAALTELLSEVASARRGFRVYYQFNMYNDPSLNPELYKRS